MAAKRAKSATAPPSLSSLPLRLFSLVLEFAVSDYTQERSPSARPHPRKHLKDVALVSKSWWLLVQQLMQQFQQETAEIDIKVGTQEEINNIQRDISARGAAVRDLRVRFGQPEEDCYGAPKYTSLTPETEKMQVDWDALMAKVSGLTRLDLKLVPQESQHLTGILKAAGTHCWELQVLVMPRKDDWKKVIKGKKIDAAMKALYALLERCYVEGGRKGLKQLTVPTRNDRERHRSISEFLEQVARF